MHIVLFCHSLVSCWNHGNAHFLRGVCQELLLRGHSLRVYEPQDSWSRTQMVAEQGPSALEGFRQAYPRLRSHLYEPASLDLDRALAGADLVLVHEWSDPALVKRIGRHRRDHRYRLFFHDTHHRSRTDPKAMSAYALEDYDGVLAFGEVIRELYLAQGWAHRAWTWHEAADARRFHPVANLPRAGDLIWIGNWGDEERTAELEEFLLKPVADLHLSARVHGVRYPPEALGRLRACGIDYRGWLPNHAVPRAFARFGCTVHVPRRPYAQQLPGIPTIRMFEALACGIPLVTAPWNDSEHLFHPGSDYLVARDGDEMRQHLRALKNDPAMAREMAARGRATVLARHTCAHRVDQLLAIHRALSSSAPATTVTHTRSPA
ncbi:MULTISPECIES: glycosyltransferase [Pseudacidovorax]|uniref:CgeB family protein n=1 Tax=Pseudacidovorax TaxID=433923 RepID=UPI001F402AF4|nr:MULTISPECIES: glycosyltransferase [Pseudacidovorax]